MRGPGTAPASIALRSSDVDVRQVGPMSRQVVKPAINVTRALRAPPQRRFGRRRRRQRRLPMDIVAIREMGVKVDQAGQESRGPKVDDGSAGRHRDVEATLGESVRRRCRTIAGSSGGPPRPSMRRGGLHDDRLGDR